MVMTNLNVIHLEPPQKSVARAEMTQIKDQVTFIVPIKLNLFILFYLQMNFFLMFYI
jgi:hypothetical protein